jgi:N-methylhydantoinase A
MVRALRVMTVERGVDPREFALLAFGGAGGLHAAEIATELGMTTVLCPRASGVLAALGLVAAERRSDAQRSVLLSGDDLTAAAVAAAIGELARDARGALGDEHAALRVACDLRYRGQAFELTVATSEAPEPGALRDAFHDAHEHRYGYADREAEVELVTLRVAAALEGPEVTLAPPGDAAVEDSRRTVIFGGAEHDARVLRGEPPEGTEAEGPALFELPEATLAVPPGWRARADASGTLVMTRDDN